MPLKGIIITCGDAGPDILWQELAKLKKLNGMTKFGLLVPVARLFPTILHSNADEECLV